MKRAWNIFLPVLLLLLVVGSAELAVRVGWVKPTLLPPPSDIFRVFFPAPTPGVNPAYDQPLLIRNQLLTSTWHTAKGALVGFALSVAVGTLTAILMAASSAIRRALFPYAILFQTVPIIAIAPLLVIWFDYGLTVVVVTSFIASVFPIIANTLTGLLSTDTSLREMFRLYRASPLATILKLRIPAALPNMFTGYRIAGGLAVIGAIVGEFSIGSDSLGSTIETYRNVQRTDVVFAAVLLASLLGILLFTVLSLLSTLLLRHWHASEQQ